MCSNMREDKEMRYTWRYYEDVITHGECKKCRRRNGIANLCEKYTKTNDLYKKMIKCEVEMLRLYMEWCISVKGQEIGWRRYIYDIAISCNKNSLFDSRIMYYDLANPNPLIRIGRNSARVAFPIACSRNLTRTCSRNWATPWTIT